jgi:peroxisome-assembly ATPase
LTATQNDTIRPRRIRIKGREVEFAKTCGTILDATFDELCLRVSGGGGDSSSGGPGLQNWSFSFPLCFAQSLGPIDYVHLSHIFDTFIIRNVPVMSLKERDQMRRFIALIDDLYDQKVKLVVLADAPPERLFTSDTGAPNELTGNILMDDLGIGYADVSTQNQK